MEYKVGDKVGLYKVYNGGFYNRIKPSSDIGKVFCISEVVFVSHSNDANYKYILSVNDGYARDNFIEIKNNEKLTGTYIYAAEEALVPFKKTKCPGCI